MVHFHIRGETKPAERRTAVTPDDAKRLIEAGHQVTVESFPDRCFPDAAYAEVGCAMAEAGSWEKIDQSRVILGLKELPEGDSGLPHQHIMFAHCFKYQDGWKEVMKRFTSAKGTLFDIEFLKEENGRRKVAFGKWAGFCGMGTGILCWALQQQSGDKMTRNALPADLWYRTRDEYINACADAIKKTGKGFPKVMIIGALGRCGSGATEMALATGIPKENIAMWDMAETSKGGPFKEILDYDVFVSCIYLDPKTKAAPFLTTEMLNSDRKLSVMVDVSCDPNNPANPVPVYKECTTFLEPVNRIVAPSEGKAPFDVIALDHFPSLVPCESSTEFSAGLLPMLIDFEKDSENVWSRAKKTFEEIAALPEMKDQTSQL